jgi:hypothetical protein
VNQSPKMQNGKFQWQQFLSFTQQVILSSVKNSVSDSSILLGE